MTKISAQKAIHNYCKGCIYDPLDKGTWRDQVERCTITHCELFEHRPRSTAYKREQRERYLQSLTPELRAIEVQRAMDFGNKIKEMKK